MLRTFAAVLVLLAAFAAPTARAQDDGSGIPAVIADQIGAFLRGDLDAAWAHASPTIQGVFGTPERFGQMVREGYPMVWRPSRWEMRERTAIADGFVQTVLFEDAQGRLFLADYEMRLVDGVWRINGVALRELPGMGA